MGAPRTGEQRQVAQDRVPQARLYKVWNVPGVGEADNDYLLLLSDVLVSDKASRLYKRLVYDEQIATDVGAFLDQREIGSLFIIQVTAKPGGDLVHERPFKEEMRSFFRPPAHDEQDDEDPDLRSLHSRVEQGFRRHSTPSASHARGIPIFKASLNDGVGQSADLQSAASAGFRMRLQSRDSPTGYYLAIAADRTQIQSRVKAPSRSFP